MKNLWLIPVLALMALLTVGCNQQPDVLATGVPPADPITIPPSSGPNWFPEDPNFRLLTDNERQKVIEIALKDPRISEWLQERTDFRVGGMHLYAIIPDDSDLKPDGFGPGTWWALDYEVVEKGVNSDVVPKTVKFYPGVTIAVGEGTIIQAQIAVDLTTEEAVMVLGPLPSLASTDRFK